MKSFSLSNLFILLFLLIKLIIDNKEIEEKSEFLTFLELLLISLEKFKEEKLILFSIIFDFNIFLL